MPPDENPDAPVTAPITTVIVETPPLEVDEPTDHAEALEQVSGRIEAVETRITEGLEGERAWTLQTITSLQQEIADLRANLSELATGLPAQVESLKGELTRLSHSLPVVPEEPVLVAEVIPPAVPESEVVIQTDAPVSNALPKGKRRVV